MWIIKKWPQFLGQSLHRLNECICEAQCNHSISNENEVETETETDLNQEFMVCSQFWRPCQYVNQVLSVDMQCHQLALVLHSPNQTLCQMVFIGDNSSLPTTNHILNATLLCSNLSVSEFALFSIFSVQNFYFSKLHMLHKKAQLLFTEIITITSVIAVDRLTLTATLIITYVNFFR